MIPPALAGLDLLAAAVVLLDDALVIRYVNPATEHLFEVASRSMVGEPLTDVFKDSDTLLSAIGQARRTASAFTEHELTLAVNGHPPQQLSCTVVPVELESWTAGWRGWLLELRPIEQQIRIAREERLLDQTRANRELIRNLAHEIKNPLGGIRGAAQLLDRELDRPALHEYTQVIMKEADRLQALMDRLLTPHRLPQPGMLNIHEALERVRSLVLAEFPDGLALRRDYDTSLPHIRADREQMIQSLLNVARNAAQAMQGRGLIVLRTRIARQVVLARRRYRHALDIEVIDNGPGIPEPMRERIFYPLVSGREGGSGLGLTIAQTFITQHGGTIDVTSEPGRTCFRILLPVEETASGKP
jgi:two-component system nitrogen regulation sensor histidine kinase GlnL